MNFVDAVLAYRIVTLLSTPFSDMEAHRLGLIDDEGKQLKKPQTPDEQKAWSVLTRVVVRIKRAMLYSSAASSIASLSAAYWLVRECYDRKHLYSLNESVTILTKLIDNANIYTPIEERVIVESVLAEDDVPTNNTTGIAGEHEPVITPAQARRYREFNVSQETFQKFSKGKKKFSRWSAYLDLKNEEESALYQYARKNPRSIIVLKNGDQVRAIRFNRRGGGNWHKIGRQIKESTTSVTIQSCNVLEL